MTPLQALTEFLASEERLWRGERELLQRIRKFLAIRIDKEAFVHESAHAREALSSIIRLSALEDNAAIAEHLLQAHKFILTIQHESKEVVEALEHAIHHPSDITFKHLDNVLKRFERDEDEKLRVLSSVVQQLKRA